MKTAWGCTCVKCRGTACNGDEIEGHGPLMQVTLPLFALKLETVFGAQ